MKKIATFALFAAVLAAPLSKEAPAHACMEAIEFRPPTPAKPNPPVDVAAAEKSLDAAQPWAAARQVLKTFPDVKDVEPGADPLKTRALRVLALANVRADGELNLAGFSGHTKEQREANFAWSVAKLEAISQKRQNDPALQADLGEAMAKIPSREGDALKVLASLADKDLMGSPHAYAALARLRAQAGDRSGSELAMKRCEQMTKNPGAVCKAPAKHGAKPVVAASFATRN